MEWLRWLCVSALAYGAALVYALGTGFLCALIAPEAYPGAVKSALLEGGLGGLLLAPLLGVWILRDVNQSVTRPEEVPNWWRRAHVLTFKTALAVAAVGLLLGTVFAAGAWHGGSAVTRAEFCWAFAWGSAIGAGGAACRAAIGAFSDREADL